MFSPDEKIRFWLCQRPVSMRYGIRGLDQSCPFLARVLPDVGMRFRVLFRRPAAGEDTSLGL